MVQLIDFYTNNSSHKDDALILISNSNNQITPINHKKETKFSFFEISMESRATSFFESIIINSIISTSIESLNSSENTLPSKRVTILNPNITTQLISLIKEEHFEFGYISKSEDLVRSQLQANELATRNWINEIFVKYFDDEIVLIGILRIIGRFDENLIFPQGQTIALAALNHKNNEIKELGIRAFEKWSSMDSLNVLKKLTVDTIWLQEYVNQVVVDLEEQLCHC